MLDEADQMLERGFADSVEEILAASFKGAGLEGELNLDLRPELENRPQTCSSKRVRTKDIFIMVFYTKAHSFTLKILHIQPK